MSTETLSSSNSSLTTVHQAQQNVLVIGTQGSGKTTLIESMFNGYINNELCCESMIKFRDLEISLKIYERAVDGSLDLATIPDYYRRLHCIIAVFDIMDPSAAGRFRQLREALDSLLSLYDGQHDRPTVFILANVLDREQCDLIAPSWQFKHYVREVGALPLYNYCLRSSHLESLFRVFCVNAYCRHFNGYNQELWKAVEECYCQPPPVRKSRGIKKFLRRLLKNH